MELYNIQGFASLLLKIYYSFNEITVQSNSNGKILIDLKRSYSIMEPHSLFILLKAKLIHLRHITSILFIAVLYW